MYKKNYTSQASGLYTDVQNQQNIKNCINIIHHNIRIKKKISIVSEKAFDRIQHNKSSKYIRETREHSQFDKDHL